MIEVLSLAIPFFGLILIGFASGRTAKLPESAPILYIALAPIVTVTGLLYPIQHGMIVPDLFH